MTLIKICGVRSPEVARTVAESGADLLGMIFAPARRQVLPEQATAIVAALRSAADAGPAVAAIAAGMLGADRAPAAVGVFVDESPARMNQVADAVGLDLIQLSGDEPPSLPAELARPAVKALRLTAGTSLDEARREAERYLTAPVPVRALLLDTHVAGSYGGNGVVGDWALAAALARDYPVMLAGGLRVELLPEAIAQVNPLGVDVSSGVETGGEKDHDKIREFVAAARLHGRVPIHVSQSRWDLIRPRVDNRAVRKA